jgi:hypothetical protein
MSEITRRKRRRHAHEARWANIVALREAGVGKAEIAAGVLLRPDGLQGTRARRGCSSASWQAKEANTLDPAAPVVAGASASGREVPARQAL